LYEDLAPNSTVVRSNVHRYVIDANRDPSDASLYPGQNTTSLCPTTDFDGKDIWQRAQQASEDEIAQRREDYHLPYHAAVLEQIERVKDKCGTVVLYDCHSIRSEIPFLFDGQLPVFNIGTNGGVTCHRDIETATFDACISAAPDQTVLNGRFKGGWTTRRYGDPENGVHAVQMETAQRAYMDETPPWTYRPQLAQQIRPVFANIFTKLDQLARSGSLAN
jgi:formiminoglutamase